MANFDLTRRAWPIMCAAYRDAGLAGACLAMQEQFDADVPLLLVLCIADRVGHGLSRNDVGALVLRSAEWRDATVLPLRRIRRGMKGRFADSQEVALRGEVKRLELEAERLHVQRLVHAIGPATGESAHAAADYLALLVVPTAAAAEFLQIFNHAYDAQVGLLAKEMDYE